MVQSFFNILGKIPRLWGEMFPVENVFASTTVPKA